MSNPEQPQTIEFIRKATVSPHTGLNNVIDTAGYIDQRFAEISDDYILVEPTAAQTILGSYGLTVGGPLKSTGALDVGDSTTGANAKVWGTFETTGATTSGGALTVSSGGATITAGGLTVSAGGAAITGNSTITGTTTSTGDLTVGATGSGNGANVKVFGDVDCVSLTLPVYQQQPQP